jgi:hypothetical protein
VNEYVIDLISLLSAALSSYMTLINEFHTYYGTFHCARKCSTLSFIRGLVFIVACVLIWSAGL